MISGNTVTFQTGTPAYGISTLNCSNVVISGNNVDISSAIASTRGIYTAGTAAYGNITITGNTVLGCATRGISVDCSGFTASNIVVNGNVVTGGGTGSIPIGLSNMAVASITGNNAIANTVAGMDISAVTQGRFSGNTVSSSGATSVHTNGTCTNSVWSEDNYFNGNFSNNNSGFNCRQMGSASPTTGIYQLGDTMWNTGGALRWVGIARVEQGHQAVGPG